MIVPHGSTDRQIAFVAVDVTDLKTREVGLTGFTVYRSRNGGTATVYTTPTITELSAANMPGVYVLTIDEDTSLPGGIDMQEYVVHITHASMAPVTRAILIQRVKFTEGEVAIMAGNAVDADIEFLRGSAIAVPAIVGVPKVDVTHVAATAQTAGDIIADTNDIQARLPAALVGGRIDANVGALGGVVQSATDLKDFADDGYDPVTNKVQGVVLTDTVTTYTGNTPQTGDAFARLGAPAGASVSADIAAIEAQTDDIGVAGAGLTALGDTRLANLDALVSSRATPAQVNAEMVDALSVDAYAEPGQEAPPASTNLARKLGHLYKTFRNKITQDATTLKVFADDGLTVDAKATVSDDATTFTREEMVSGP